MNGLIIPMRSVRALLPLLLAMAFFSAHGATVDFSGKSFKPGSNVVVTSTDTVPATLLYQVAISATGASTGSFVPLFGSGDLGSALFSVAPDAWGYMQSTIPNTLGELPATLTNLSGRYGYIDVPVNSGTAQVWIKAHLSLVINKNGTVTAGVKGLGFTEKLSKKAVLFSGTYTLTSGMVTVEPLVATSSTAEPAVIALRNPHIGDTDAYQYASIYPGNTEFTRIKAGTSKSTLFIVQNNGPATDSFTLVALPTGNPNVTFQVFDGKANVTNQAKTGYVIPNLPSSGLKLIRLLITTKPKARLSSPNVVFKVISSSSSRTVYAGTYPYIY